jgi:hypothetical protein
MSETTTVETDTAEVEKKFSQEDLERILSERLERKERKTQDTIAALEQKLSEYTEKEEKRKKAEMSEIELVQKEKEDALSKMKMLEDEIKQTRIQSLKTEVISEKASHLPRAYRLLVSGNTKEEIEESIEEVKKQFELDFGQVAADKKNIGSPTNVGNQPNIPQETPEGGFRSPYQEMMEKIRQKQSQ